METLDVFTGPESDATSVTLWFSDCRGRPSRIFCAKCAGYVAGNFGLKDLEAKGLGLGYSGMVAGAMMTIVPIVANGLKTAVNCTECDRGIF
jgi:hypothetical protein